jgi:hypothetical protein
VVNDEFTILEHLLGNHVRPIQAKLREIQLYLRSFGAPHKQLRKSDPCALLEVLAYKLRDLEVGDLLAQVEHFG